MAEYPRFSIANVFVNLVESNTYMRFSAFKSENPISIEKTALIRSIIKQSVNLSEIGSLQKIDCTGLTQDVRTYRAPEHLERRLIYDPLELPGCDMAHR